MSYTPSYSQIKFDYPSSWFIPYKILLSTLEWQELRYVILSRDGKACTVCMAEESFKIGNRYYRKPTNEEIAENNKPYEMDLGDNTLYIKHAPIVGLPTDTPTILHIHHKYYVYDNLPWDYPLEAFQVVCQTCHFKIHSEDRIPVYSNSNLDESYPLTPCTRCHGSGFLQEFHYHREGICFRCEGRKFEEFIVQ